MAIMIKVALMWVVMCCTAIASGNSVDAPLTATGGLSKLNWPQGRQLDLSKVSAAAVEEAPTIMAAAASELTFGEFLLLFFDAIELPLEGVDIPLIGAPRVTTITMSNIKISNLGCGGLPSTYTEPNSLTLSATGCKALLTADYEARGLFNSYVDRGTFSNMIEDTSSVVLTANITSSEQGIPLYCNASSPTFVSFKFGPGDFQCFNEDPVCDGTVSSDCCNADPGWRQDLDNYGQTLGEFDEVLNEVVTPLLEDLVETNVSALITDLGEGLLPLLESPVKPVQPEMPSPPFADLGESELMQLGGFLVSEVIGVSECIGLNALAYELTNGTGAIDIEVPPTNTTGPPLLELPGLFNLSLDVEGAQLSGLLHTFEELVLWPAGPQSLLLKLEMNSLGLGLDTVMGIELGELVPGEGPVLTQNRAHLDLELSSLATGIDLWLALDQTPLEELQLGQLADNSTGLDCLLYTLDQATYALNFTQLNISVALQDFVLEDKEGNALDADSLELITNIVQLFIAQSEDLLPTLVRNLFDGLIKDLINQLIAEGAAGALLRSGGENPCGELPEEPVNTTTYIDLEADALVELISSINAEDVVNPILSCELGEEGAVNIPGPLGDIEIIDDPLLGTIIGTFHSLNISGLNAFDTLDLFVPQASDTARFGLALGKERPLSLSVSGDFTFESAPEEPLLDAASWARSLAKGLNWRPAMQPGRMSLGQFAQASPADQARHLANTVARALADSYANSELTSKLQGTVEETLTLGLTVQGVNITADVKLLVDAYRAGRLTFGELFGNAVCLMSTLDELELSNVFGTLGQLNITMSGAESEEWQDVQETLNKLFPLIADILNWLIEDGATPISEIINEQFLDVVWAAPFQCQGMDAPPRPGSLQAEEGVSTMTTAIVSAGGVIVFLALLWCCTRNCRKRCRKRHRRMTMQSALNSRRESLAQPFVNVGPTIGEDQPALVHSKDKLPGWLRWGMIFMLLANMGLFLASHISVGAALNLRLKTNAEDAEEIIIPGLFNFGLIDTVRDMWTAEVYFLSIFVAVFSGAWPYVKLIIMLACWVTPPVTLPPSKREKVLAFMDAFGKYSLLDAIVLVLMVVAFRLTIEVPLEDPDILLVDIIVSPEFGFYGLQAATIWSLILGHIIAYQARKVRGSLETKPGGKKEAISDHVYSINSGRRLNCTTFGNCAVVFLMAFALLCVYLGSNTDSFVFSFEGLVGIILPEEKRQNVYSLISLGMFLPDASFDASDAGIIAIQVMYFVFGLVMPTIHLLLCVFLWLKPMTLKGMHRVYMLAEMLNGWAALDVLVLAVVTAMLQIGQFAAFIVGEECNEVNVFLAIYFRDQLGDDPVCFSVEGSLTDGAFWLLGGAIIYLMVAQPMMATMHEAVEQRLKEARVGLQPEELDEDVDADDDLLITSGSLSGPMVEYEPGVMMMKSASMKRDGGHHEKHSACSARGFLNGFFWFISAIRLVRIDEEYGGYSAQQFA